MRIASVQLLADAEPAKNLDQVRKFVASAVDERADVVVFPEASMARFGIPLAPIAEPLDGPWASAVRELAAEAGVLIVVGMFTPADDDKVHNTLLITGRGVDEHYHKIHLFDAFGFAESATVAAGDRVVTVAIDGATIGVATCYDVRFPALFHRLADAGATVVLLPTCWGAGPGKREQWELLVRARALDCTSWVVGCDQADPRSVGREPSAKAPNGIGYSTVASPSGEIAAQLGDEPDILVTDIDITAVDRVRQSIPVLRNRRL